MTIRAQVCAAHPATARAGADLLRSGGSAVDAAVGMMLVSCSAEALFTGLSAGGFATVYDAASATVRCVDFFVAVPGRSGLPPGRGEPISVSFVGQQVPYEIGPATVAVHGVPAGAHHLWRRWGRLPWREVVAPAVTAAAGTPFPPEHAALLPDVAAAMCVGEGARVFCRADGTPLRAGDLLRHPDAPRAFAALADDPASFYRGPVADAIVAAADGGALSHEDLADYRVVEAEPRRVTVPTSDGRTVLAYARGDDLDDVLGTLAAAAARPGDPTTDPACAVALVDALRAPDRRSETTNLLAVDADGNVCVITTSLGLGSAVYVAGLGVHLNSMLGEGELVRADQRPGQRMGSMMSPMILLDGDGAPVLAAGAAGGSRIRPALVQTVLRMIAGQAPQAALDAPRLVATPGLVRCEPGFAPEVLEALAARGDRVEVAPARAPFFGGVSAASPLGGGGDPRRGGVVVTL